MDSTDSDPMPPDDGCAREDCWLEPAKEAYLVLRSSAADKIERVAPLGIRLCTAHALEAKLDDFLDGQVWAAIQNKCRSEGMLPPDARLTKLEMRDVPQE